MGHDDQLRPRRADLPGDHGLQRAVAVDRLAAEADRRHLIGMRDPAQLGREALARFGESSFDLVVLDVMMPQIDGLEVCRRLRAKSSVPIIMLTAKAEEIDKVLGLELGADDYITKPFSLREFRSRVKAALRRAGMAQRRDPN